MLLKMIGRRTGGIGLIIAAAVVGLRLSVARATVGKPTPHAARGSDSLVIVNGTATRVLMRNVDFRVGDGVLLHIALIGGEMQAVQHGVVDFDDKHSYVLAIDSGEVTLGADDLTNLMNRYVFAYPGAPLKRLRVTVRGAQLGLTGTMHKGVDIPFDITSTVTLTPDERMRLHPTRIRIFGVDGAKLMSALGITLKRMLDVSRAKGVTVEKNDLLLEPLVVLPPPRIQGRIMAVRVDRNGLVQLFGRRRESSPSATLLSPPDSAARNYMLYRGGTLHFGKLYMTDADMLVVDEYDADPFDFDNDHYQRQLIAGHSRTLPNLGLEVYMPDAAKLPPKLP